MRITWLLSGLLLGICCSACHGNHPAGDPSTAGGDSAQPSTFFPVTDFLLGQLREIDSMPVTPLEITREGARADSEWLKKKDIRAFAQPFLSPVIDSVTMGKFFAEKSFLDQTINAVTLTYDPRADLPDSMQLNHWDVYVDPEKGTVQRIYMVKSQQVHGAQVTTQLTWRANKWCSIRTITEGGGPPVVRETLLKWVFDE